MSSEQIGVSHVDPLRHSTQLAGASGNIQGNNKRLQLKPRTSSLALPTKYNASNTSINSPRQFLGSGLKQEVLPASEGVGPQNILQGILGRNIEGRLNTLDNNAFNSERPRSLNPDVPFEGQSLTAFSRQIYTPLPCEFPQDKSPTNLSDDKCEAKIEDFEHLQVSIQRCDGILGSVESSLSGFQRDLGNVSSEIESLQARSTVINTKLRQLRLVESILGPAVEELSISPRTVVLLLEGSIDEGWIFALIELDKRLERLSPAIVEPHSRIAQSDMTPLLESLKDLVVERARDYLVSQIRALRSPNINAQITQQRALLPCKELFGFVSKHHPQLASNICQAYSNTMRWYYQASFSRYRQALERLSLYAFEKQDALGNESPYTKGSASTSNTGTRVPHPWSIGHRSGTLTKTNPIALSAHVALEMKSPCYIETPFQAFTTAIAANASAEYAFLTSFFATSFSPSTISKTFHGIFAPTFELGQHFTKQLIGETIDCIGLLLCVRITQQHAFALQRKKCPVTEGWINGTNMLLWPRFQSSMDIQIESIRLVTASVPNVTRATLSLSSAISEDAKGSIAPHPVTQRFGQLLQSLLALSNSEILNAGPPPYLDAASTVVGHDFEPVARSLQRLRNDLDSLLTKLARAMAPSRAKRFLANNYSLVLTIIADTSGKLAQEQREWLRGRKDETGVD